MDITLLIQSVQYLLPVTIAILGLSIFLFGFQSVKEPDYSYINNIVTTRKKKQQPVKKINGVITAPKPTSPVIVKSKVENSPQTRHGFIRQRKYSANQETQEGRNRGRIS